MAIASGPKTLAAPARKGSCPMWLRRVGVAGFIFFLVKGLLWLMVPVLIYFGASQ